MMETGVPDTQERVKIPVNYCDLEDLLAVGATPQQARDLLGLRSEYGSLTPELFEASDIPGEEGLADRLDFCPRVALGKPSTPSKYIASDHDKGAEENAEGWRNAHGGVT